MVTVGGAGFDGLVMQLLGRRHTAKPVFAEERRSEAPASVLLHEIPIVVENIEQIAQLLLARFGFTNRRGKGVAQHRAGHTFCSAAGHVQESGGVVSVWLSKFLEKALAPVVEVVAMVWTKQIFDSLIYI
jgi:hypothetical protein